MKGLNDPLAYLRRFEPVIRSERVDLIKNNQSRRPTLQTQPPDLLLESRGESSARGLQTQGRDIERVQPTPRRWVSRLGIRHANPSGDLPRHSFFEEDLIHRDSYFEGCSRSSAVRYARAVCILA